MPSTWGNFACTMLSIPAHKKPLLGAIGHARRAQGKQKSLFGGGTFHTLPNSLTPQNGSLKNRERKTENPSGRFCGLSIKSASLVWSVSLFSSFCVHVDMKWTKMCFSVGLNEVLEGEMQNLGTTPNALQQLVCFTQEKVFDDKSACTGQQAPKAADADQIRDCLSGSTNWDLLGLSTFSIFSLLLLFPGAGTHAPCLNWCPFGATWTNLPWKGKLIHVHTAN